MTTSTGRKEWMLGIPGHNELVNLDAVLLLLRGGQLRPTDLVKKLGEPWRAANEVSELAPHFTASPPATSRAVAETIPLKPSEMAKPSIAEPGRSNTERMARSTAKPPESTRSLPRAETRVPPPRPAEDKPADTKHPPSDTKHPEEKGPIRSNTGRVGTTSAPPKEDKKAETKPPPAPAAPPKEEKKEEKKPETKVPATAAETTDKISNKKLRKLEVPKPPPKPEPKIEPMVGKYFSPVDMLRSASFAFEPKKLLFCFPVVILMVVWSIGMYRSEAGSGPFEGILWVAFMAVLVFGLAFILTGLAFVSRRQLEGRDYYFSETLNYTVKSAMTGLIYPVIAMAPSILSLIILYGLRWLRNRSPGMAATLKVAYIVPMIFAFVVVLGAIVYQIASMYVPAAGAIEGEGLGGSVRHAWSHVRRQWGRVVLHWLIVTVAFGVITAVCVGLAQYAIVLPEKLFRTDDPIIENAWDQFSGLFAIYRGLAYGLGMMLPVSLFSTLGTLSYMSLRHPAGAQLSPAPMDETSGISLPTQRGSSSPMEATRPSDTRPAPPEASPGYSEISDDSDEQPLVKDQG